jgi:hypothetical protein
MKRFYSVAIAILLISPLSGCSVGSLFTPQAAGAALAGGALGSGVGWAIGEQVGNTSENVVKNGLIGGGIGLLSGAWWAEFNKEPIYVVNGHEVPENRTITIRRAVIERNPEIESNQAEIDYLRQRLEEKEFGNHSYPDPVVAPQAPYQGVGLHQTGL